jgi:hypothetical protein
MSNAQPNRHLQVVDPRSSQLDSDTTAPAESANMGTVTAPASDDTIPSMPNPLAAAAPEFNAPNTPEAGFVPSVSTATPAQSTGRSQQAAAQVGPKVLQPVRSDACLAPTANKRCVEPH